MRKIGLLFREHLRRNRLLLVLTVAVGVLLCALFGFLASLSGNHQFGGIPVGVIDRDSSSLTAHFQNYLSQEQGMQLTVDKNYDELSSELIERHISAVIEIPEGFSQQILEGKKPVIEMTTLDDYQNAAYLQSYLDSYLTAAGVLAAGAQGDAEAFDALLEDFSSLDIPLEQHSVSTLTEAQTNQRAAFLTCMGFFVMLCSLFSMSLAFSLLDDREKGVYQRIQVASVKPVQYVVGMSLFGLFNCLLFSASFLLYTQLSGYAIGVPLVAVAALSVVYSLFVIGFALVAALCLSSKNAISALVIGVATIASLLGGAYFPIETSPQLLQKLALLTPHYWFMDALRSLQESSSYNWGTNVVAILLFSLLCFLLAGVRFSRSRPCADE